MSKFNQSRNTGKVSDALAKTQAEMGAFVVDKAGYNYKYLTLAKILDVLLPIAGKHSLSIAQFPTIEVFNEEPWVNIMTRISCADEYFDSHFSFPMIQPTKKTDTEIMTMGSTISYMRRYALQSIFGISGADKDPEEMQAEEHSERPNPNATKLK